MNLGDTFVPEQLDHHLWIITSDPSKDKEKVVIMNLTTYTIDEEEVCVLQPGDHPFVKHKTAIRYYEARIVSLGVLTRLLDANALRPHQRASSDMMAKIWRGAAMSRFIPGECVDILEEQSLLP